LILCHHVLTETLRRVFLLPITRSVSRLFRRVTYVGAALLLQQHLHIRMNHPLYRDASFRGLRGGAWETSLINLPVHSVGGVLFTRARASPLKEGRLPTLGLDKKERKKRLSDASSDGGGWQLVNCRGRNESPHLYPPPPPYPQQEKLHR